MRYPKSRLITLGSSTLNLLTMDEIMLNIIQTESKIATNPANFCASVLAIGKIFWLMNSPTTPCILAATAIPPIRAIKLKSSLVNPFTNPLIARNRISETIIISTT